MPATAVIPSAWRSTTQRTRCGATETRFISGRAEIVRFLTAKWERELDYALRKSLREFDEHGLMRRRDASINDVAIEESERRIRGPRPPEEHGAEIPLL